MPALLNPKWETACQALARGETKADAYRSAGFKYIGATATKFFQRPNIAARVAEIVAEKAADAGKAREMGVQKAGLTEQWIIERIMWLTERSLRGQPVLDENGVQTGKFSGKPDGATAARMLELASRIKGLLINRHEIGQPGDFERMDDQDLDKSLEKMARELGYSREDLRRAGVAMN